MAAEGTSPAYLAIRRQFEFAAESADARLDRLEMLLQDIDPASTYPIDWLVYRVTGIRPEASSQTDVVEGHRLLGELVVLIEEVDRKLGPRTYNAEIHVDAEEAARRIGVSRRTLQRWRHFGLPMRMYRHPGGTIRAGVRRESLGHFARGHPGRISRARGRSRIQPDEDESIRELLRRLRSEGVETAEAIRITAGTFGRSPSAVRSRLDRRDSREAAGNSDRRARLVGRARARCISRAILARRLDRTEETIRRHELDARWKHLLGLEKDEVDVPNIDRDDAIQVFGAAGMLDELPRRLDGAPPELWLDTVRSLPEQEEVESVKARLAAMHYARSMAAAGVSRTGSGDFQEHHRLGDRVLDPIESSLRWWGLLLERNTISGLAAGLRRLEQSIGRRIETLSPRRLRSGLDLLMRATSDAVRSFDPSRQVVGHDLDRAVGLVVARRIASSSLSLSMTGPGVRRIQADRMPVDLLGVVPRRTRDLLAPERWWRVIRAAGRADEIREAEGWELLARRFALETPGRPGTLSDVAASIGRPSTRFIADLESATSGLRRIAVREIANRVR